jgi:DNA-binding MarR family transcriptional regulator
MQPLPWVPVPPHPRSEADEAWLLLGVLAARRGERWLEAAGRTGLTPVQGKTLLALDPDHSRPMGALAGAMCLDRSYVTELIDQLEDRGYVRRRPDPRDRRVKVLAITPQGIRAREELLAALSSAPGQLTELPDDDLRELLRILRRIAL